MLCTCFSFCIISLLLSGAELAIDEAPSTESYIVYTWLQLFLCTHSICWIPLVFLFAYFLYFEPLIENSSYATHSYNFHLCILFSKLLWYALIFWLFRCCTGRGASEEGWGVFSQKVAPFMHGLNYFYVYIIDVESLWLVYSENSGYCHSLLLLSFLYSLFQIALKYFSLKKVKGLSKTTSKWGRIKSVYTQPSSNHACEITLNMLLLRILKVKTSRIFFLWQCKL